MSSGWIKYTFIKSYKKLFDGCYKSILTGKKKGEPCLTDVRCLTVGYIRYKLEASEELIELPRRTKLVKHTARENVYTLTLQLSKK